MAAKTAVIDASVAAKWFLKEHDWEAAEALLGSSTELIAPELVIAEVLNIYWKQIRAGRKPALSIEDVVKLLTVSFAGFTPVRELALRAAEISLKLDHPIYDAFYIALAERETCAVITADTRLLRKVHRTPYAKFVRPLSP